MVLKVMEVASCCAEKLAVSAPGQPESVITLLRACWLRMMLPPLSAFWSLSWTFLIAAPSEVKVIFTASFSSVLMVSATAGGVCAGAVTWPGAEDVAVRLGGFSGAALVEAAGCLGSVLGSG